MVTDSTLTPEAATDEQIAAELREAGYRFTDEMAVWPSGESMTRLLLRGAARIDADRAALLTATEAREEAEIALGRLASGAELQDLMCLNNEQAARAEAAQARAIRAEENDKISRDFLEISDRKRQAAEALLRAIASGENMVGRSCRKVGGDYESDGVIRAAFYTGAERLRFVVELAPQGLLHIFRGDQLRLSDGRSADVAFLTVHEALDPAKAPGHTDMMVAPEALDEWLEDKPPPIVLAQVRNQRRENEAIISRVKGLPSQPATAESNADPSNPTTAPEASPPARGEEAQGTLKEAIAHALFGIRDPNSSAWSDDLADEQASVVMGAIELRGVLAFAHAVQHGDPEHRAWLLEAAREWIAGRPIPPPRSAPARPADARLIDGLALSIMDELRGRSGFDGVFDDLDDDLQHEIWEAICKLIEKAALSAPAASGEAVAWRVKDFADGWIYCPTEEFAQALSREQSDAIIQALYLAPPVQPKEDSPDAR